MRAHAHACTLLSMCICVRWADCISHVEIMRGHWVPPYHSPPIPLEGGSSWTCSLFSWFGWNLASCRDQPRSPLLGSDSSPSGCTANTLNTEQSLKPEFQIFESLYSVNILSERDHMWPFLKSILDCQCLTDSSFTFKESKNNYKTKLLLFHWKKHSFTFKVRIRFALDLFRVMF